MLVLPVAFWASTYYTVGEDPTPIKIHTYSGIEEITVPARESWPTKIGLMGIAWAVGVAAFYTMTGSIHKDKRLVLCGYRSWQILGARLILLMGIALLVSIIPLILFVPTIAPLHPELVWLASFLVGLIAVEIGLFIGTLIPRPTEGVLVLVALFGIGMSLPGTAAHFFPTYPANQLLYAGVFAKNPLILPFVWHALLIISFVAILSIALWSYRVRIWRW
ncbi:MAG: hypothetical protein QMD95_04890 [Candidatus Hodarchaeaceae archaeon]|nr:hypothetical protein [Candidatus Hodarchaeaceae archaeon]